VALLVIRDAFFPADRNAALAQARFPPRGSPFASDQKRSCTPSFRLRTLPELFTRLALISAIFLDSATQVQNAGADRAHHS